MKLGLVSAILQEMSFDKMMEKAAELELDCVEVAVWPRARASRRYAGVTHIDVDDFDAEHIQNTCKRHGVSISALGYYPNPLKDEPSVEHIRKVIDTAAKLSVDTVTTFVGRIQDQTLRQNLELFSRIWPPIIAYAERKNIKIAIENCPMLFTEDEWPGGQNLFTTPAIWRELFELIPSPNFGINYDPSHFIWQQMDYITPLYTFADRIYHVHFKDIKLYPERLNEVGIMAPPLSYMSPKLPGLGDVNFGKFVSALTDIGYHGAACIEIEDRAFEGSEQDILRSITLATRYMRQFVI